MPDPTSPRNPPAVPWATHIRDDVAARGTEKMVRETWRHYYVAQLAEAQFGPASLEAALARSQALESYRDLRAALRDLDPYYRNKAQFASTRNTAPRHLALVRDETGEISEPGETPRD